MKEVTRRALTARDAGKNKFSNIAFFFSWIYEDFHNLKKKTMILPFFHLTMMFIEYKYYLNVT